MLLERELTGEFAFPTERVVTSPILTFLMRT